MRHAAYALGFCAVALVGDVAAANRPESFLCSYSTSVCAGSDGCEVRQIVIWPDGEMSVSVKRAADGDTAPAAVTTRLSKLQLAELRVAIARSKFFALEREYIGGDSPADEKLKSIELVLRNGNRKKTVSFKLTTAPPRLLSLARTIETMAAPRAQ